MPNWCSTDYTFIGSEKDVKEAYSALSDILKINRQDEDAFSSMKSDNDWVGYVAIDILKEPYTSYFCRGNYTLVTPPELSNRENVDKDAFEFSMMEQAAWEPCQDIWMAFAEKFNLSCNLIAIEPGLGLFYSYSPDKVYTDKFYADHPDLGSTTLGSLQEFIECFGEEYGLDENSTLDQAKAAIKNDGGILAEIETDID